MLEEFKKLILDIQLKILVVDFEVAIKNAFRTSFSNATIKHCLFHFGQAIWQKISSLGLSILYRQDNIFRFDVRKILALVFIRHERIPVIYNLIKGEIMVKDYYLKEGNGLMINKFFSYFEEIYLNMRDLPWCALESVLNETPLTTDICEGYNRSLNAFLSSPGHPSLG
ncbi:hypothetical protein NGRA_1607 [Nosema granulosis]|uniref:MULE transposase domain-containing protein n=1 Tax=Nosema granulosis TaxID=83296 RepID=A0A9P6H1G4_9MICR|nr:hypothetical protein NGRA_1607 [Nosema granulosis]